MNASKHVKTLLVYSVDLDLERGADMIFCARQLNGREG